MYSKKADKCTTVGRGLLKSFFLSCKCSLFSSFMFVSRRLIELITVLFYSIFHFSSEFDWVMRTKNE